MRKGILKMGVLLLIVGALLLVLSGADPPRLPYIYGSNQTYWMLMGVIGVIMTLMGLIMGGKKKNK